MRPLGWALVQYTDSLQETDQDTVKYRERPVWRQREQPAIYKPTREASEETMPANTWSQASNLQNNENTSFHCLIRPIFGTLLGSWKTLLQEEYFLLY